MKDNIKTAEEILWESCKGISHDQFLEIIKSTKEYASQFIDIAAEEATFKTEEIWSWGDSWKETIIEKESILKVKQLIK